MTIYLGIVVLCILGLLVYVMATNPKAAEIGRLVFFAAFLALCLGAGPHLLRALG